MPRETSLVTTTGHDGRSVALTFDDGPTGVTPGAVVLLHDGGGDRSQTVCAVEQVVPGLTAQGWRFHRPLQREPATPDDEASSTHRPCR